MQDILKDKREKTLPRKPPRPVEVMEKRRWKELLHSDEGAVLPAQGRVCNATLGLRCHTING